MGSYFKLPEINLPAASINEMLRLAGVDINKHNSDIAIVVAKRFADEVIHDAGTNMDLLLRSHGEDGLYDWIPSRIIMLALTNFAEKFSQMDNNRQTFDMIEADGDDDNSLSSFKSTSLSDADDVSFYYDSEDEDDEHRGHFILDEDSPLWGIRDTSSATTQLFDESFAPIEEIDHLSDTECINNIVQPIMKAYHLNFVVKDKDVGLFKRAMYSFVVSCLEHCNSLHMTTDAGRYINWIHLSSGTKPDEQPSSQASIQGQPSLACDRRDDGGNISMSTIINAWTAVKEATRAAEEAKHTFDRLSNKDECLSETDKRLNQLYLALASASTQLTNAIDVRTETLSKLRLQAVDNAIEQTKLLLDGINNTINELHCFRNELVIKEMDAELEGEVVPPQAEGQEIKVNDSWDDAWKKMLKSGWGWKTPSGSRVVLKDSGWGWKAPSGLMVDCFYMKPGSKTKGGVKGQDYFESVDDVKAFAMRNYGWRGEEVPSFQEEEEEEDNQSEEVEESAAKDTQLSIQGQPSVAAVSFQEEDTTSESEDSATSSSQVSVADLLKRIHGLEYENKKCKEALKRKNVEFVDLSEAGTSNLESGDNSAKRARLNENEAVSKSMARVKQEEDHEEGEEEEEEETSDRVLVVGTSTTSRVTRASVASTIRQVVKREDPINGSIRCPDRSCNMIIPFTNGGCNVLTCRACFGYFCVHCYKPCEENYSTCGCSKRITHDDLVEAQQLRNEWSRENPVTLE